MYVLRHECLNERRLFSQSSSVHPVPRWSQPPTDNKSASFASKSFLDAAPSPWAREDLPTPLNEALDYNCRWLSLASPRLSLPTYCSGEMLPNSKRGSAKIKWKRPFHELSRRIEEKKMPMVLMLLLIMRRTELGKWEAWLWRHDVPFSLFFFISN